MGAIQTIRTTVNGLDELSGLIANPPADRPVAAAIGNTGRKVCDAYANVELAAPLLFGPTSTAIDLVCKPYFDGEGFDGPQNETPFQGGQCAAPYRLIVGAWTATIQNCPQPQFMVNQNFAQAVQASNLAGPITGIELIKDLNNACGPRRFRVMVTTATGPQTFLITQTGSVDDFIASGSPSFSLERQDGPDNCGNPPGELVPGQNPPPSPGPFPQGQEPGVDPTGQPFFFIPDIEIPGFDPLPLDDEPLGGAPGGGAATPAGGDGLPGDPDAIGDEAGEVTGGEDGEEIDFGEPPEGRIWIGCIIETSSIAAVGNIAGTGPQSTVWPTVRANAALIYGSRKGTSQRINSKFHDLIRSATSLIVTGVFLQVQPGSTSKIFPLSALTCPENPCVD